MFISTCLAYSDIGAEISQHNETFKIALKTAEDGDIRLTMSYAQTKVLADALVAIINQAPVRELLVTEHENILGNMNVTFCLPYNEIDSEEGEKLPCQQPSLSVPMEPTLLSESA